MAAVRSTYQEGLIPFKVEGDTHHTWYRLFGDLSNRTRAPLVVLHGGPGLPHDYLIPIADLFKIDGIPVIFYDQLGTGRSTHLPYKPNSFWTFDLFLDELTNLLNFLGVQDGFDLLGHSWGGMLAAEFVIRRRPSGLRHLVLSNSSPSKKLTRKSHAMLHAEFSKVEREAWLAGPAHPLFMQASTHYFSLHGCLVQPLPEEFRYSLAQGVAPTGDTTVFDAMNQGELKNWSIIDKLHTIRVQTLVINGRADYFQDFVCAPFFTEIPRVKWVTFEASSHSPFWEERERYMHIIGNSLAL
ncbi:proline-specific peptidase [Laetiporus sulphureus 93-53]|uniref:Proline-specific peptidase n=1 Tax=Laetiporus sulphureus 93-53 TaxID=1314785 RepID=A0A165CWP0_9APHY|nr:proline-specific peptidase [Laetiporus sulphureus 93-53]KZT03602.1 proline-specific peptidase [Laetiporus sulphureus 93-53]